MAKASRQVPGPEGCASLYAYLLSDASAEISGEILSATGGYVGHFPKPTEHFMAMKKDSAPWSIAELDEALRVHFCADAENQSQKESE